MDEEFHIPSTTPPYPIPAVLDLLGFQRASGKVQISNATESFSPTLIVGESWPRARPCGRCGSGISCCSVALSNRLLARCPLRAEVDSRWRALGAALVEEGAVTRDDLTATVEEQIVEILARLIALEDATAVMVADAPLPEGIAIAEFDTRSLIAEANQRHAQRAAIRAMQRLLPAPEAELRLSVQLALVSYLLSDSELLVALQLDRGVTTLDRLSGIIPSTQWVSSEPSSRSPSGVT